MMMNASPVPSKLANGPDSADHLEEFSGWFVVETQPNKERFALENLQRQSFRTFFPRFHKTRSHARKTDIVLAPLFPGYLFLKTGHASQPVRPINGTFGVRRFVAGSRGRPAAMPVPAMANLMARCRDGIVHKLVEPLAGSTVRILRGPMANRLATVESLDTRGRVYLLLELLGQDVRVAVDQASLGPA